MMQSQGYTIRTNGIIGFLFMVLVLVGLFFIAKGIFKLLLWLSPVLIIGALLIHYQTVIGFLKYLWNLLRSNPVVGILAVVLTAVGYPLVCGYLFGKSVLDRKVRKLENAIREREQGEFVEYVEVVRDETTPSSERNKPIELPPLESKRPEKAPNRYEDLF